MYLLGCSGACIRYADRDRGDAFAHRRDLVARPVTRALCSHRSCENRPASRGERQRNSAARCGCSVGVHWLHGDWQLVRHAAGPRTGALPRRVGYRWKSPTCCSGTVDHFSHRCEAQSASFGRRLGRTSGRSRSTVGLLGRGVIAQVVVVVCPAILRRVLLDRQWTLHWWRIVSGDWRLWRHAASTLR